MNLRIFGLAIWLAGAPTVLGAEIGRRAAPTINVGGVVNAASFTPAPNNYVAPNAIISIFGQDLSLRTREVRPSDLVQGRLPTSLGGVTVVIAGILAPLYYVSPTQINAQTPSGLLPGEVTLRVVRESLQSELETVKVRAVDPGLFPVVTHADFSLVGWGDPEGSTPAQPGEMVILFGTGFGPTVPFVFAGELPNFPAPVILPVRAWLAESLLPPDALIYVGQTPGLAGLYQINLLLPADTPEGNLEAIVEIDGVKSQPRIRIAVDR